jgi:hypothetical protein
MKNFEVGSRVSQAGRKGVVYEVCEGGVVMVKWNNYATGSSILSSKGIKTPMVAEHAADLTLRKPI